MSFHFLNDICGLKNWLFPNLLCMKDFSYITNSSPAFIENLYRDFVKDPGSVDPELKSFFEGFDFAMNMAASNGHAVAEKTALPVDTSLLVKEFAVYNLILAYRKKGHL